MLLCVFMSSVANWQIATLVDIGSCFCWSKKTLKPEESACGSGRHLAGHLNYCSILTCRSRLFPPLWRHVHRAERRCCPVWASPDPPGGPLRTGNTPEGGGGSCAHAPPPPEGWAPAPGNRSVAHAPSGRGAALPHCLRHPAIPARQNAFWDYLIKPHLSQPNDIRPNDKPLTVSAGHTLPNWPETTSLFKF